MGCCCWSKGSRGVVLVGDCECFEDNLYPQQVQITIPRMTVSAADPCAGCNNVGDNQALCDALTGRWVLDAYTPTDPSGAPFGACAAWRTWGPFVTDSFCFDPSLFTDGAISLHVDPEPDPSTNCQISLLCHLTGPTFANLQWFASVAPPIDLFSEIPLIYQTGVGSCCNGPPEPGEAFVQVA